MKDITPYLKYYIGRPCLVCYDGRELPGKLHYSHMLSLDGGTLEAKHIKPILRRLSSITEEELIEYDNNFRFFIEGTADSYRIPRMYVLKEAIEEQRNFNAAKVHWLIQRGFWLFGDEAFDSGAVIDVDTIQP